MPETVEDYDYGLKNALEHLNDEIPKKESTSAGDGVKDETASNSDKENEQPGAAKERKEPVPTMPEIPEDAFLMVTQVGNKNSNSVGLF